MEDLPFDLFEFISDLLGATSSASCLQCLGLQDIVLHPSPDEWQMHGDTAAAWASLFSLSLQVYEVR